MKDSVAKNIFYLYVKLKPKGYLLEEVKIKAVEIYSLLDRHIKYK